MAKQFLLGIDAGGTFTDFVCVELGGSATFKIHKALSTPAAPEQAILHGITALGLDAEIEKGNVAIVHGSTVATNAVLEGRGARTAFVTNSGFADMLQLARQTRPELYALEFAPISPPVAADLCLEIAGRVAADGSTIEDITEADLQQLISEIKSLRPDAVAINLLFSFLNSEHEKIIEAAIKAACPEIFLSRSSSVLPEYREYERGIATWLNASLGPVVSGYLRRLQQQLKNSSLQIMQSSGETIDSTKASEFAVNLLLSGPAGGLTAIKYLAGQTGTKQTISFDMGGTSTDVALLDGDITTTNEGTIARYPVGVAMVDMHTIGAGGGSIAYIDSGGMLQVGPRSAGAEPGPACYDKGGREATVTDANLVLGRLLSEVNLAGSLVLNKPAAIEAIEVLAVQLDLSVEETALGIVSVANEHMAKAIRLISVSRGYDTKGFVLASFGGAGGLHVCAIAEAMGMTKAQVPIHSGVLSALGMIVADRGRQYSKTVGLKLKNNGNQSSSSQLEKEFNKLEQKGRQQFDSEGLSADELLVKRSIDVRYIGQSYTLNIPWIGLLECTQSFQQLHEKRYGYSHQAEIEIVNCRVQVIAPREVLVLPEHRVAIDCKKIGRSRVYGCKDVAKVVARKGLAFGQKLIGPLIITEFSATTYVAPGWIVEMDRFGNLLLENTL